MESLNLELLEEVFGYLNDKDFCYARSVSKSLNTLPLSNLFWKSSVIRLLDIGLEGNYMLEWQDVYNKVKRCANQRTRFEMVIQNNWQHIAAEMEIKYNLCEKIMLGLEPIATFIDTLIKSKCSFILSQTLNTLFKNPTLSLSNFRAYITQEMTDNCMDSNMINTFVSLSLEGNFDIATETFLLKHIQQVELELFKRLVLKYPIKFRLSSFMKSGICIPENIEKLKTFLELPCMPLSFYLFLYDFKPETECQEEMLETVYNNPKFISRFKS